MVEVVSNNTYGKNDTVWWFDQYGTLKNGKVMGASDTGTENFTLLIAVGGSYRANDCAKPSECWPTREECIEAEKQRSRMQRAEFKESIETVTDLVTFLFAHDVTSVFRDADAYAAAAERARELLSIDADGIHYEGVHRRPLIVEL